MEIKKDDYFWKKGGTAILVNVSCVKCGKLIFVYQKDWPRGWLKRCYLNRIMSPEYYEKLQNDPNIKEVKDMSDLVCSCGSMIGLPMKHKDGRLAFNLIRGKFKRTPYKEKLKLDDKI